MLNYYITDYLLKFINFHRIQTICFYFNFNMNDINEVNRILFNKFNKKFAIINSKQYNDDAVFFGFGDSYIESPEYSKINNNHIIINDNNLTKDIFDNIIKYRSINLFPNEYIIKFIFIFNNVKILNESIFSFNSNIINISLPISLEKICDKAFYYTNINNMYLPHNLKHIGYKSFSEMHFLKNIYIPPNIKEFQINL